MNGTKALVSDSEGTGNLSIDKIPTEVAGRLVELELADALGTMSELPDNSFDLAIADPHTGRAHRTVGVCRTDTVLRASAQPPEIRSSTQPGRQGDSVA